MAPAAPSAASAASAATAGGFARVSGRRADSLRVLVGNDSLSFSAAHFVAFRGFRERLHGHNYRLAVAVVGDRVGADGYVVDFGALKRIARQLCQELHEAFLVPMKSDVLDIHVDDESVSMRTEDDASYCFPRADCALLPIVHSSAEELAAYITGRIIDAFTVKAFVERGARTVEVSISEADRQLATCERNIVA